MADRSKVDLWWRWDGNGGKKRCGRFVESSTDLWWRRDGEGGATRWGDDGSS
ncbi:hypothetical protein FH972_024750 [Carpinus fangiana]|uniref:Uncharacterized protein n=1 Tax=Carpinus fangiana TaxID=176857 RepID=A0A5N6KZL6_9ROSI|nr:hypothetical protein FH972_024750 [Carpinus fangiana]